MAGNQKFLQLSLRLWKLLDEGGELTVPLVPAWRRLISSTAAMFAVL